MRIVAVIVLLSGIWGLGIAQTRSGLNSSSEDPTGVSYPCMGTVIYSESFDSGIPMATWQILDFDSLTPHPTTNLQPGWQSIQDYRDSTNTAAASPSWYLPVGQSEDWLITPSIQIGTNTCFSWKVYSQDPIYPEDYEVLISTTADTASFLANPPLFSTSSESGDVKYRNVMLDDYANQSVFIAFRQTSNDEFVLVIDDVSFTEVNQTDAGAFSADTVTAQALAASTLTGTFFNFGTDTLQSVDISWQEGNGSVQTMSLDSLNLPANTECSFMHTDMWTPSALGTFDLCFWTSNPNGSTDENVLNDTICTQITVTEFVGIDPAASKINWELFPNPASSVVQVRSERSDVLNLRILNLQGQLVGEQVISGGRGELNVSELPAGVYLILAEKDGIFAGSRKLIRK